jgi:Cu-processing system ATP-binding protein
MLVIKGLSKKYGKLQVLKNLDLDFNQSGIYVVLGPNGSGKTTLIKCILGMVLPEDGTIFYDNQSISGSCEYRKNISYLPQIARFPENLTGRELIAMIKDIRKTESYEQELIDLFELEKHLDKNLKHLSGGTKQKINTVIALMFDSQMIILDEPTAGLDPISLIRFRTLLEKLSREGKIIIITTHVIDLVEKIADRIIFLLEGETYFNGSVKELIAGQDSSNLEEAIANILENNHV